MLVRLVYASRTTTPLSAAATERILAGSRQRNLTHGITGLLCHSDAIFMQVIEGGREAVNRLYNRILQDARHHDVTLLHYEEINERCFAGWTMGQVNLAQVNPSVLLKYSERPVLDPYAVSGKMSIAMLEELVVTASIVGRPC